MTKRRRLTNDQAKVTPDESRTSDKCAHAGESRTAGSIASSPVYEGHKDKPASSASADIELANGLSSDEAAARLSQYGPNTLEEQQFNPLTKFLSYFWGPIPWMIEIAAALSATVQRWDDFAIIVAMLMLNAGVGFWQEFKADNAITALKQRLALRARVLRDGIWKSVPAAELVPGDIVRIHLGNIIPADARLVKGDYLSVDQSALTGESLPVDKKVGDVAYSGSIARMGDMTAAVTATGGDTYFGRTAKLVQTAGRRSHFQEAVLKIGNFLILSTIGLVALILLIALWRGTPLAETLLFALILTVAAIPVALPAVLSVTMAVGAMMLAQMKAIVSRLVSIEEMAGMDILCSDKTGTLTQNKLAVGDPVQFAAKDPGEILINAALASRADADDDPIDSAIMRALGDRSKLEGYRQVNFQPFDPVRKRADAEIEHESGRFMVVKGAPQVVLDLVSPGRSDKQNVADAIDHLAQNGYRTLGVARKGADGEWRFLGLLPLFDPPREDTAETIETAGNMGLGVKMITGDNIAIAREMSRRLGLGENVVAAGEIFAEDGKGHDVARIERVDGFAEVFPEQKYDIVNELQSRGHIVGMTGDGVNDAPALAQADVGIAVSGATDAARAAADLILTEAGLSVIGKAVQEARRIFERMTSYATYRITETIRVLVFMTLSIVVFDFYPVTAVMIVLLAILNDFPIMMIAYDNASVAERPVRWDMHRVLTISTVLGLVGVIETFLLFWLVETYLHLPRDTIQTVIFLKLLVAGHLTLYVARNPGWFWNRPLPNWRLFLTTEATQVLGTLAAVYGWFVAPIGWKYALAVWAYALLWLPLENLAKVLVFKMMQNRTKMNLRHLASVHGWLHSHPGTSR